MEKILIVDDSRLQAAQLKNILEDIYDVTVAQTAEEGLECTKNGGFSLILLDVIMPGMDGFTLLKKLQAEAATQSVPVILITSLSSATFEEQGLVLGAVDYITKPFEPMIVKARVNTHIKLYNYRRQAEEQCLIDPMTGAYNRRGYEQCSAEKWKESLRLRVPLSIGMFDVDHFKKYNDTFGHPAGDKVIASVAKTIASCFQRSTDFFCRYGGEEFVVLTMGEPAQKMYEHMEKVRQAVEDLHISHDPSVAKWVTVSIGGVTAVPKVEQSYETVLQLADAMLYDAKNHGRNRVVWTDENGKTL